MCKRYSDKNMPLCLKILFGNVHESLIFAKIHVHVFANALPFKVKVFVKETFLIGLKSDAMLALQI